MDKDKSFCFEDIKSIIEILAPSMDDYAYVMDLKNDIYYISPKAVDRFCMDCNYFDHAAKEHEKFVHPDDLGTITRDLEQLKKGIKTEHSIQYRWLGKEKETIWIFCRGRVITDTDNNPRFMVGCVNEIGKKPMADNVSGLLDSSAIETILSGYYANWTNGYILRIGIDDFKDLNEKFGMEYGDFILRGVSECIISALQPGQKVFRALADEFIVLDLIYGSTADACSTYRRIRSEVDSFIARNNYEAVYTISGGIINFTSLTDGSYEEVMRTSQFALSEAKLRGKNQVYLFTREDYDKFLRKRVILREIKQVISEKFENFQVFYQPIVHANTGELYAAEALLRFRMPDGEMVSPIEFIPILEETGWIIPVGRWLLSEAVHTCKIIQEAIPDFRIHINLSYVQILKSSIVDDVLKEIRDAHLDSSSIIVELTESGYLENSPMVLRVWKHLKEYGVPIALDDFGTGYSNLQSVGNLKPNVVKLDRGFTLKALTNEYEHLVMKHVIEMVHSLHLKICVEGIEKQEELDAVRKLNVEYIQGYFFGKPCSKRAFFERYLP